MEENKDEKLGVSHVRELHSDQFWLRKRATGVLKSTTKKSIEYDGAVCHRKSHAGKFKKKSGLMRSSKKNRSTLSGMSMFTRKNDKEDKEYITAQKLKLLLEPYNNRFDTHKWMRYDDIKHPLWTIEDDKFENKWKYLTNFIIDNDKNKFRDICYDMNADQYTKMYLNGKFEKEFVGIQCIRSKHKKQKKAKGHRKVNFESSLKSLSINNDSNKATKRQNSKRLTIISEDKESQ